MGTLTFSGKNAMLTLLVLGVEIIIALFIDDRFVRPFLGDILAIILVYLGIKTFVRNHNLKVALVALSIAIVIEIVQALPFLEYLGLAENRFASIVLGSSFDWKDILCYVAGFLSIVWIEKLPLRRP